MLRAIKRTYFFIKGYSAGFNHSVEKEISYRIVDFKKEKYWIQCVNTKSVFKSSLLDIVFDLDILYSLHPIQACYVGMRYSEIIKKNNLEQPSYSKRKKKSNKSVCTFKIRYQDRLGNYCYVNTYTNEEFIEDPRDISFFDHKIEKFSAEEAFYIGMSAGLKLGEIPDKKESSVIPFRKVNSHDQLSKKNEA